MPGSIYKRSGARRAVIVSPAQLAAMLEPAGFKNRLIILQACFSGQFVPALEGPRTVVATACCRRPIVVRLLGRERLDILWRCPDQPGVAAARPFRPSSSGAPRDDPRRWEQRRHDAVESADRASAADTADWLAALDAREPEGGQRAGRRSRLLGIGAISCMRTLLRPTGFVDSPFGHDGKVARLAGGLNWFAAVELIRVEGNKRVSRPSWCRSRGSKAASTTTWPRNGRR